MKTFDVNSGFMYIIVSVVILFVLAQSVYFLIRAWRRGKELGISVEKMKKVAISSSIFTIAPAVAILIGVIALSKSLGFPMPWLRLSVVGAITYETAAAATAAEAAGVTLGTTITNASVFAAIAWVMTIGIIPGLIEVPLMARGIENGIVKLKNKDQKWGEIFLSGLFLGMISAFLGMVFATVTEGLTGWIPVFVMICSAVLMALCGLIRSKTGAKWIEDYALPISLLGGMMLAIPITNLVNSIVA